MPGGRVTRSHNDHTAQRLRAHQNQARIGNRRDPAPRSASNHHETDRKVLKFVGETLAETAIVGVGGVLTAVTLGKAALVTSTVAATVGSGFGAALGSGRAAFPNLRISSFASMRNVCTPTMFGAIAYQYWSDESYLAKFMYMFNVALGSSQIIAGSLQQDVPPQDASDHDIATFRANKIIEWGVGGLFGTCAAGTVASVAGSVGLGLAAGVVTFKAARAGARALLARNWI